MSLNNKRDDFSYNDLLVVAKNTGIKSANDIIGNTLEIVSRWSEYAKEVDVNSRHINKIKEAHRLLTRK
jgi:hypothetical protein